MEMHDYSECVVTEDFYNIHLSYIGDVQAVMDSMLDMVELYEEQVC